MSSRAESRPPSLTRRDLEALGFREGADGALPPRVSWDQHLERMEGWRAGQHLSIFAPTEGGKTHLTKRLLPLWQRYPVLWIRFKQRDRTLSDLPLHTVKSYPGRWQRERWASRRLDDPKWETDPEWFLLVLPTYRWSPDSKRLDRNWQAARKIAGEALDRAYHEGGILVVVDEAQAIAGRGAPALDLGDVLTNDLQRGRDQPLTIVAGTQQPANAVSAMYDQPTHIYLGKTLDAGRWQRLGEIGGDTDTIRRTIPGLRPFEFLYVHRQSGDMEIVQAPA